jgi:hypothetical protein
MKSRRLQKSPELKVTWDPREKHLEEAKTHLAEVGPRGPNTDRSAPWWGRSAS